MSTFLGELAAYYKNNFIDKPEDTVIVFPNIRAGLFFRKELSERIDNPIWAPNITGIEEFIRQHSGLEVPDKLSLVMRLYSIHTKHTGNAESFDRFYFWGRMLLQDFEDIDRYLVDPKQILNTIRNLKDIDLSFNYLDEEQARLIKNFWGVVINQESEHKDNFLKIWKALLPMYVEYRNSLLTSGYAYQGMIYRQLAEQINREKFEWKGGHVIFAGFNAFSKSEEIIVKWFIQQGHGEIFWDIDSYYLDNEVQEAGYFFRNHIKDDILKNTFPENAPSKINRQNLELSYFGIPSVTGQAKVAGSLLKQWKDQGVIDHPEKTVVVLPDETLLMNTLQAIPESFSDINVTMGYPLKNTAIYGVIDNAIELQKNLIQTDNTAWFFYRDVLALLNYPLVKVLDPSLATELIRKIKKRNMIRIRISEFKGSLLAELFKIPDKQNGIFSYLMDLIRIMQKAGTNIFDENAFQEVFFVRFYKLFQRLKDQLQQAGIQLGIREFQTLFKQVVLQEKVPFEGEPVKGIQIMGVLETRNLDFDNIVFLSMNEGVFPSPSRRNSFIPYNVRKGFDIPNFEHQDAIYAYLFYRLLQRSKKAVFIYNTQESKGLTSGEISRFLLQLKNELRIKPKQLNIGSPIKTIRTEELVIEKDDFVLKKLESYILTDDEKNSWLTPSAIIKYLDCPLSFFYSNVLGIKENEEVSEEMDAALFGNILHRVMEKAYAPLHTKNVTAEDIKEIKKSVPKLIHEGFAKYYGASGKESFRFEGRNIVAREILKKYVHRILAIDSDHSPFKILGLEKHVSFNLPVDYMGESRRIMINGVIDRIDQKDGVIRIIDYKTGRDETTFSSLEDLFDASKDNRNKAVLQTLLYAHIYNENYNPENLPIQAGLFNRAELMNPDFDLRIKMKSGRGKAVPVGDVRMLLEEYLSRLSGLLVEIYDPSRPFQHHEEQKDCKFCKYSGMANGAY